MSPKTLILAGLGKYAPASDQFGTAPTIQASVASQMQTLTDQGFVCANIHINPQDPTDSLRRVMELIQSKEKCDGFVIGFGLRGNTEYTDLFEKVVNVVVERCSGVRFGFSDSPTGLVETVGRMFPEGASD